MMIFRKSYYQILVDTAVSLNLTIPGELVVELVRPAELTRLMEAPK